MTKMIKYYPQEYVDSLLRHIEGLEQMIKLISQNNTDIMLKISTELRKIETPKRFREYEETL